MKHISKTILLTLFTLGLSTLGFATNAPTSVASNGTPANTATKTKPQDSYITIPFSQKIDTQNQRLEITNTSGIDIQFNKLKINFDYSKPICSKSNTNSTNTTPNSAAKPSPCIVSSSVTAKAQPDNKLNWTATQGGQNSWTLTEAKQDASNPAPAAFNSFNNDATFHTGETLYLDLPSLAPGQPAPISVGVLALVKNANSKTDPIANIDAVTLTVTTNNPAEQLAKNVQTPNTGETISAKPTYTISGPAYPTSKEFTGNWKSNTYTVGVERCKKKPQANQVDNNDPAISRSCRYIIKANKIVDKKSHTTYIPTVSCKTNLDADSTNTKKPTKGTDSCVIDFTGAASAMVTINYKEQAKKTPKKETPKKKSIGEKLQQIPGMKLKDGIPGLKDSSSIKSSMDQIGN